MKEINTLKSYSKVLSDSLLKVSKQGPKRYNSLEINMPKLGCMTAGEFNNSVENSRLIETFGEMKDPCVYWFEISSETDMDYVWKGFQEYKAKKIRVVPATKKHLPQNTRILYLGKVKKRLIGRLKQHLGYTDAIKTQSLQLCHWAIELNLIVRIHVLEFEQENSNLVGVFEFKLAREMRPILGKHTT